MKRLLRSPAVVVLGEVGLDPVRIEAFAGEVNRAFGALRNELGA